MVKTKFEKMDKHGKVTTIVEIDLAKVKSPDPLAYAFGYSQGLGGTPVSKNKDLAKEYIRGHKEGKAERIKARKLKRIGV